MFIKVYRELVLIRKELQTIRNSMEFNKNFKINPSDISQAVQKANHDTV